MQQGAFNYLLKPLDLDAAAGRRRKGRPSRAAAAARTSSCNRRLDEKFGFEGVIGSSPQMNDVIDRLKRIAPTDASVLIQGETGTGKELVAQAIHQNSPRKNKPFVALNCAALSENILESELFGHVQRGVHRRLDRPHRQVRVRQRRHAVPRRSRRHADGHADQAAARAGERRDHARRLATKPIKVNVRILSATNRNLEDAIAAGTFRSDLYHRLKVVTIDAAAAAPSGRQDIPLLIEHFHQAVRQAAPQDDQEHVGRGAAKADGVRLAGQRPAAAQRDREHGGGRLRRRARPGRPAQRAGRAPAEPRPTTATRRRTLAGLVGKPLEEIERLFIAETLELTGGNREEAAEMLGIGERTLYRKIKEWGLVTRHRRSAFLFRPLR